MGGHPDPRNVEGGFMPNYYDIFMDEYVAMAENSDSVYFIDTRTWTWMDSWDYFDEDQSHPGPLARIEMGRAVAAIIKNYKEEEEYDDEGEGEGDQEEEYEDEEEE